MRAIVLSVAVLVGLGQLVYAQTQPQTLRGVYGPPKSSALGLSAKPSSNFSGLNDGPIGTGPRVIVPGTPARGDTLPPDVTATPLADRPGYGAVVVNGRRAIVDLNNNRIVQLLQ